MAQFEQVAGRQVGAHLMVDLHPVGFHAFHLAVDDHGRRAHVRQPLGQRAVAAGGRQDQAVDAFLLEFGTSRPMIEVVRTFSERATALGT